MPFGTSIEVMPAPEKWMIDSHDDVMLRDEVSHEVRV